MYIRDRRALGVWRLEEKILLETNLESFVVTQYTRVKPYALTMDALQRCTECALSILIFFVALFNPPKQRVKFFPHTFHPFESLLQSLHHHGSHYSVGCCIDPSNSSHPSPILIVVGHQSHKFRWPMGIDQWIDRRHTIPDDG